MVNSKLFNSQYTIHHSELSAALDKLDQAKFAKRLWDRDPALWKNDPEHQKIIRNSLGWLTVSHAMREQLDDVLSFVQDARRAGFTQAVVLGMGGSSLCPDVCRVTFGTAPGFLQLQVLDSTVPANILRVERSLELPRTLFLVSSKSGGTVEPLSFFKYFYEQVRGVKGDRAGENFVAITDPGTSLEKLAVEKRFRRIFHGQPDIGGRYSALSNFGIVPTALAGVDVRALLASADRMAEACGSSVPARENPGLALGALLAEAARAGRDKVTFVVSPGIQTFADWAEQLIAESTGKEGKGLVPVAGEELGAASVYGNTRGNDRIFVYMVLRPEENPSTEARLKALEAAGHPVVRIELESKLDLGQEFFRWEVATATAGALLGINAFDQPNVQESKDNTNRLLAEFRSAGKLPQGNPVLSTDGIHVFGSLGRRTKPIEDIEDVLAGFLSQTKHGDYVALLAYVDRSPDHEARLANIRTRLRDSLGVATTLGYGPRFLHSTGQLHKGGPNNGLFIQITADDAQDAPVPGEPYSFSILKQAQALGDLQSLESKKRRVVRFHLGRDVSAGLDRLLKAVGSVSDAQRGVAAE